jgi:hypothetical protein
MKKIIIIIIGIFYSLSVRSQSTDYPKYYIQNGDTLGIIYSIEQAQKMYNHEVLLSLFKDVRLGCDSLLKRYFVVVNKYEQKQLIDKLLIDQLEKDKKDKDLTIQTLTSKNLNLEKDLSKCDDQKKLQSGQIENFNKIVEQLQSERKWLIGGTLGFGALSLFLLGTLVN